MTMKRRRRFKLTSGAATVGATAMIALAIGWDAGAAQPPRGGTLSDPQPGRATAHGQTALEAALKVKGISFTESARLQGVEADIVIVAGLATGAGAAAESVRDRKSVVEGKS